MPSRKRTAAEPPTGAQPSDAAPGLSAPDPAAPAAADTGTPERADPQPEAAPASSSPVPEVTLGQVIPGGLAPAILAIVERGVRRRPDLARALWAEAEFAVDGEFPPVRVLFTREGVLVEDGPAQAPDLRVRGALGDLIGLLVAPAVGGVPLPVGARGRNAIALMASRRIRVQGRVGLLRRLLGVIRI